MVTLTTPKREKKGTDKAASNDMLPPMAGRTSEPIVAGISENAGVTENTETTEAANHAKPTPMGETTENPESTEAATDAMPPPLPEGRSEPSVDVASGDEDAKGTENTESIHPVHLAANSPSRKKGSLTT